MNKKRIITGILLIILISISFLGGSTFAKYLSSYTNSVSTQVAKWNITESFLVNGKASSTTPINLANSYDIQTLTGNKIAPGTSGNFGIKINATGTQTGVNYQVTFTNISTPEINNLKYTYLGNTYSSLSDLQNAIKGTITAEAISKIVNIEIGWLWPYETLDSNKSSAVGDAKDSVTGTAASTFGFDVNVICTQVSPKTAT